MNQTIEKILHKHLSGGYGAFRAIHEEIMQAIEKDKVNSEVISSCGKCPYVDFSEKYGATCRREKIFKIANIHRVAKQCPLRGNPVTLSVTDEEVREWSPLWRGAHKEITPLSGVKWTCAPTTSRLESEPLNSIEVHGVSGTLKGKTPPKLEDYTSEEEFQKHYQQWRWDNGSY